MYSQKAYDILSTSVNSAIFIDEKAKDFFSNTPVNTEVVEEDLSINLYNSFKENGKNLVVHKFEKSNIDNVKIIDYLFKGRDLILLDWELDDLSGQEFSLKLLSKAIEIPYINFCCIYSRSNNFNDIPKFLSAYFSGLKQEEREAIKNQYSHIEVEEIKNIKTDTAENIDVFFEENEINIEEFPVERYKAKAQAYILDLILISLESDSLIFPEDNINEQEIIFSSSDSFIINNTLVFLLKKDKEVDGNFSKLIKRISDEVVKNNSSFFQLLGLEMQSIFNNNERFIDETILRSSTEALFSFRNHLKSDKTFGIIIKKLLLEQATLKLRTAKLQLLETEFLEGHGKTLTRSVSSSDLMNLNTFYNSVSVKSLNDKDMPNLNFGDIFKDKDNNYYLCITALCDCYYPNKIQSNFYFVQGKEFEDPEVALKLGDTAFLSFLPNNKVVYWGALEYVRKDRIKKEEGETDEAYKIRKLENELKAYKNLLYKPFYVKPKVFNVENNKLINNKISIWDITNKFKVDTFDQDLNRFEIEYITTLRNDYTQRIANHAFGHPARVGVDFVKKT